MGFLLTTKFLKIASTSVALILFGEPGKIKAPYKLDK
jgi:hypothetical protein